MFPSGDYKITGSAYTEKNNIIGSVIIYGSLISPDKESFGWKFISKFIVNKVSILSTISTGSVVQMAKWIIELIKQQCKHGLPVLHNKLFFIWKWQWP